MAASLIAPPDAGHAPVALLEADDDARLVAVNDALVRLAGREAADLLGRRLHELLGAGARVFLETHCMPVLRSRGHVAEVALDLVAADGRHVPVHLHAHRDAEAGRLHVALVTAFDRDVLDGEFRQMRSRERARSDLHALTQRLSDQALRGGEPGELYAVAAEGLAGLLPADLVTVAEGGELRAARRGGGEDLTAEVAPLADPDRWLSHFRRQAVVRETGAPAGAGRWLGGREVVALSVPIGPREAPHGVLAVYRRGDERPSAFEIGAVQAVASVLWTAVLRFHDVRDAEHRAVHDPLTGLPNRQLLLDRLGQELRRARRTGRAPALLFLDLDDFKLVNDALGHRAGDALLRAVAGRLGDGLREADTVARLGGDEFVVLCPAAGTAAVAEELALRVHRALADPIDLDGHRHRVRASVGVVLADPAATAEQLLGDADTAMYRAKALGRGRHVVFDAQMREQVQDRLQVEAELHDAIAGGHLRCHLQPIVDLADGRAVGLEALVRWEHPVRGLLQPGAFIDVAQQSGLIDALGAEVLEQACGALADLRRTLPAAARLHLTVNVSVSQLLAPGFADGVAAALRRHGLAEEPGVLRLEVTESLFADRQDAVSQALDALRALGVTVLVDDFGTGFSSLARLRTLPIDGLKIDRSFVAALGADGGGDAAVVSAILELAGALGLDVVCEGVETEGQRARLRELGGLRAQGFLFAEPLPPAELRHFLAAAS